MTTPESGLFSRHLSAGERMSELLFGLIMTLVGTALGGVLVARLGILRALLVGGVLQAMSNLVYAWQAMVGHSLPALAVTNAAAGTPPEEDLLHIRPTLGLVTGVSAPLISRGWFLSFQALPPLAWLFLRNIGQGNNAAAEQ